MKRLVSYLGTTKDTPEIRSKLHYSLTEKKHKDCTKLSTERQREYVDKAKARNDAYEDDEVVIHETQPLINETSISSLRDNEVEYNESLIAEQEGEIREIEQGINELNEIFRDLGTLVSEQQSMLADELSSASRLQKKARNRMCCFAVVAVVGGIVILAALA
ncbi:t-SNARE [Gigaspora margarita]|uniref:t-SNARE n=1 Tax=Gigaspora margarita TaxID=4874 RepID=A0A8H4ACF4_GIGMA|nr:t-SNARE [Gigaspora margarita]